MPFNIDKTKIEGVVVITPKVFKDERGYFLETFKQSDFDRFGINKPLVQANQSYSTRGVLRGLHYQKAPQAQGKLVRVLVGEIFDVAVDIRDGSPTYGQWVAEILSAENKRMMYVPEGFAHGFCVLSEIAEVLYSCTREYAPDCEAGIIWNDPDINITWPIHEPLVSGRDQALPRMKSIKKDLV